MPVMLFSSTRSTLNDALRVADTKGCEMSRSKNVKSARNAADVAPPMTNSAKETSRIIVDNYRQSTQNGRKHVSARARAHLCAFTATRPRRRALNVRKSTRGFDEIVLSVKRIAIDALMPTRWTV